MEIYVERNPKAVSPNKTAFVILGSGATPNDEPIGQLFIGTILSSPVLYYRSVNCTEQRITLFLQSGTPRWFRSPHELS